MNVKKKRLTCLIKLDKKTENLQYVSKVCISACYPNLVHGWIHISGDMKNLFSWKRLISELCARTIIKVIIEIKHEMVDAILTTLTLLLKS